MRVMRTETRLEDRLGDTYRWRVKMFHEQVAAVLSVEGVGLVAVYGGRSRLRGASRRQPWSCCGPRADGPALYKAVTENSCSCAPLLRLESRLETTSSLGIAELSQEGPAPKDKGGPIYAYDSEGET